MGNNSNSLDANLQACFAEWKEFDLSKIFKISMAKSIDSCNLLFEKEGVRYISRRTDNNGLDGKVRCSDRSFLNRGGVITLSMVGSYKGTAFWQKDEFLASQNIILFQNDVLNDDIALFVATLLTKKYKTIGDYNALRKDSILSDRLSMPATTGSNGVVNPDWKGMESYMRKLHKEKRINQLTRVLKATDSLAVSKLEQKSWKPFRLFKLDGASDGLFEVSVGRGPLLKDARECPGATPLVSSTVDGNGVSVFTSFSPTHDENVLTLAVNGSVGACFYQGTRFCATSDIRVLRATFCLDREIGIFLSVLISRYGEFKYSYGNKWTKTRMAEDRILLPVNECGEPDWKYVRNFMSDLYRRLSID